MAGRAAWTRKSSFRNFQRTQNLRSVPSYDKVIGNLDSGRRARACQPPNRRGRRGRYRDCKRRRAELGRQHPSHGAGREYQLRGINPKCRPHESRARRRRRRLQRGRLHS